MSDLISNKNPVLIVGGTGRVGRALARALVQAGRPARVVSRDPRAARRQLPEPVEVVAADIGNPASLEHAAAGVSDVFLSCGDAPDQQRIETGVIELLARRGVRHVVKLSAHAAGWDPPLSVGVIHRNIERALEASGLNWTHLRPVFFQQTLLMFADEIRKRDSVTVPLRHGRISFLDVRDVAAVAAVCLGNPEHYRKVYTLTGPQALSMSDFLGIVAQCTGRPQKLRTLPNWLARLLLPLVSGMPRWQSNLIVDLMAELERDKEAEVTQTVADIAGVEPRRLAAMVAEEIAAFGGSARQAP